jgi:hypothetical protein
VIFPIGSAISLEKSPLEEKIDGQTCSKEFSSGTRTEWRLSISGQSDLFIHDQRWHNGERDVVIARPELVPPMPNPLSALLGKQRSQIDRHGDLLRMAVCLVAPDDKGWPKKTFCTLDELDGACDPVLLDAVYDLGVTTINTREVILGEEGRQRNRLCALLDPSMECGPIALHVLTRVVPTLRHVDWI